MLESPDRVAQDGAMKRGLAVPLLGWVLSGWALAACAPGGSTPALSFTEALDLGLQQGTARFDHSGFEPVLSHVDPDDGRVDYQALVDDPSDLDAYLEQVAKVDLTTLGRDEQLALLINAYNAFTLKLITLNYPVDSIMDLPDPWKQVRWVVGGYTVSLDGIEHETIRPRFQDPRIHFAVFCASVGCPKLQPVPYRGETVDAQLESAADAALSNRRHVRVEAGSLWVTQLFEWYGEDFVTEGWHGAAASVPLYVKAHTDADTAAFITSQNDDPPVEYIPYDWSLNDVRAR